MIEDPEAAANRVLSSLFLLSLFSDKASIQDHVKWAALRRAPSFDIYDKNDVKTALLQTLEAIKQRGLANILLKQRDWSKASRQAEKWFSDGIFILAEDFFLQPALTSNLDGRILMAAGNREAWADSRRAILCSRQPRKIVPQSPFLETIASVASTCLASGGAIVSSYGTPGYDVVNSLVFSNPLICVCTRPLPHFNGSEALNKFIEIYEDLIDPTRTLFVSSLFPAANITSRGIMGERDHLVAALATDIYAVHVRNGGNVHRILDEARKRGVPVQLFSNTNSRHSFHGRRRSQANTQLFRDATINHCGGDHLGYALKNDDSLPLPTKTRLNRKQPGLNDRFDIDYLYHYTRSCPGPWPGQSHGQYWRALIQHNPNAAHTAFDTLCRILDERLIRASNRFIKGKELVVCFSELPPSRLPILAKWRRGLTRWSVEPYGIGIASELLQKLGARPVQYGSKEDLSAVPREQRYLFQVRRSRDLVWEVEREWRVRGSIDLSLVTSDDIVIVVARPDEMDIIQSRFGYRCILATHGDDTMPNEKSAGIPQFKAGRRLLNSENKLLDQQQ